MARRRQRYSWETPKPKTMLTEDSVRFADNYIISKLKNECANFHPFQFRSGELVHAWLPKRAMDILAEAILYKEPYWKDKENASLSIQVPDVGKVSLSLDIEELGILTPRDSAWSIPADNAYTIGFVAWCKRIHEVHLNWTAVSQALHWWNRNGTFGACKYYWPTMMQLLPKDSVDLRKLHEASRERFKEPIGVSRVLPTLRKATMVATSGLLMPDAPSDDDEEKLGVTVSFGSITDSSSGEAHVGPNLTLSF